MNDSRQFYIDVSYDHKYDWSISHLAAEVLRQVFAAKSIKFVCNNASHVCDGDLYAVELHSDDDVVSFYLRTGYKPVDNLVAIQNFLNYASLRITS